MTQSNTPSWTAGAAIAPWSGDLLPWLMLGLSLSAYVTGAAIIRRRGGTMALRPAEIVSFAAGWIVIVVAQVSPVDWLSARLFAIHMMQHELLMLIAAPLLVLGRPLVVMLWALPSPGRRSIAAVIRNPAFARSWRAASAPVTVWLLHGAALWIWHLPGWYEAAVASETVHLLQHASFFGTALLFWWTLIRGRYGRIGYGAAVLFVFTTMLHSGLLGALFTFSSGTWYPAYAGTARAWGIDPLDDQQLAGLIMWIPFGVVFLLIGLALFAAWMAESDRRLAYGQVGRLLTREDRGA